LFTGSKTREVFLWAILHAILNHIKRRWFSATLCWIICTYYGSEGAVNFCLSLCFISVKIIKCTYFQTTFYRCRSKRFISQIFVLTTVVVLHSMFFLYEESYGVERRGH
jgi:hypothetical protein